MLDARIISVNPGLKTVGELNSPQRTKFTGVIYRLEQASRPEAGTKVKGSRHFSREDAARPRVTTLVIRIMLAALAVITAIMLSDGYMSLAILISGSMVLAGLFTRPAAIVGCGVILFAAAMQSATPQFATTMTMAVVCAMLTLVVAISGPGAFSLDAIIWRRVKSEE